MKRRQTLDLGFGEREVDRAGGFPGPKTIWKLVLSLSLKDRADQVLLFRRDGKAEMWYRVAGQYHELVPPPTDTVPVMVEDMIDLARPRGLRAWIIRRLRSAIRFLEGQYETSRSEFFLWTGNQGAMVDVGAYGEGGIRLTFEPNAALSVEGDRLGRDFLARRGEHWSKSATLSAHSPDEFLGGLPPD